MLSSEIDSAILSVTEKSWRKVAMVIVKAADYLGDCIPVGQRGHRMIARRVNALVKSGDLVSEGDISDWRHSEVRLPGRGPRRVPLAPCVYNLRRLDGAKQGWAHLEGKSTQDVPTWADLGRYLEKKPICPEGGHYSLGAVADTSTCSIGGKRHTA